MVTVCLEQLHHRDAVSLQVAKNALPGSLTNLPGIATRHERRPARTADRAIVKLREAHTFRRQLVDRWRSNLAAVAAEIGKAHVIGHDDDDIRPAGVCRSNFQAAQQRKQGENQELKPSWESVRHGFTALRIQGHEVCLLKRFDLAQPAFFNKGNVHRVSIVGIVIPLRGKAHRDAEGVGMFCTNLAANREILHAGNGGKLVGSGEKGAFSVRIG